MFAIALMDGEERGAGGEELRDPWHMRNMECRPFDMVRGK
jgi:hypothetical protein